MKIMSAIILLAMGTQMTTAAEKMSQEKLLALVREQAFKEKPGLNPKTEFGINEVQMPGLWEQLQVQLIDVKYEVEGQEFDRGYLICRDGKLQPFACAFGGHGLMSGLVIDKEFFYTYSWGSGIHRSHVGKMLIDGGQLKILESGGYKDRDLFVKAVDGKVKIEAGDFKAFNSWDRKTDLGFVQEKGDSLIVMDEKGAEVAPEFPTGG